MVIDLELPSKNHQKELEDSRSHPSKTVKGPGGKILIGDGATTTSEQPANIEYAGRTASKCASNSKHRLRAGGGVDVNPCKDLEPHDGMEFDSKEDAFSFYKKYAMSVGFSTITKASRRSRISGKFIDAKFVCTRYGKKRESSTMENPESVLDADGMKNIPVKRKRGRINQSWSKTDCQACMHVKRRQDGIWCICSFIKDHNHEFFPDQACDFHGHRNVDLGSNTVGSLHAIQAMTKKIYVSMSGQSGSVKKVENKKNETVNASREYLALEEGDAQAMLEHFLCFQDENPNFFYAIDLNSEQRLRNVFWVNAKGRIDYDNFCDVVLFHTTYIKNEYKLPFTSFTGVNHHAQFVLLGCALIADESKSNFVWEMKAWLRAMGGHAPKVILTDQEKAIKEAVGEVFPDSRHCYCLWHITSKIQENLGHVIRQNEKFIAKFNKCALKSGSEEQFEKRWWKMVDRFGLRNESWIQSLYEDRRWWVPTYMTDIFLAGISTSQRPESINTFFDKFIQRKTTLKDFFDQYKTCLQEKFEEEAKADFETWHKQPGLRSPSPFGKQMAKMYTHAIFKKFQVEVLGVVACHPKKLSDDGSVKTYKVLDFEVNQDFTMIWNERTSNICCSCHLFEYNGFLCRHAMIVLQICGVHNIPSQYILKRWTKDAKSKRILGKVELVQSRNQRYNNLCQRAFKLGDEGSLSQECYTIVFKALEEALRKCESMNYSIQSVSESSSPLLHSHHDFEEVTPLGNCTSKKKKENCVSVNGKVQPESDAISMHEGWQQLEHSAFRAPILDCSFELPESIQRKEQVNARGPSLDSYFGTQQLVHGMAELNATSSNCNAYYVNQQSMQGQLNSISPLHEARFPYHQKLLGLGQLHFRTQTMQGCFDMQQGLQNMFLHDQCDVGPVILCGMGPKELQAKHLSQ